jgi:FkbM family methyltransferase
VVSSALIYADWPEFAELMFLRRSLRPGELVLDVGANVGHISLLLSDVVGPENLYAFEPTPVTFARLMENWSLNGWPTEHLFQVAVGASRGCVHVPDVSCPLTTNAVTTEGCHGGTVEVPLVPLDDYLPLLSGRRIGLLKIDIEGYEAEAFRGARQLLSQKRPRMIMFESLEGQLLDALRHAFEQSQYVAFQLDRDGRPEFERLDAQNLFAVPAEELGDLRDSSETGRKAPAAFGCGVTCVES